MNIFPWFQWESAVIWGGADISEPEQGDKDCGRGREEVSISNQLVESREPDCQGHYLPCKTRPRSTLEAAGGLGQVGL